MEVIRRKRTNCPNLPSSFPKAQHFVVNAPHAPTVLRQEKVMGMKLWITAIIGLFAMLKLVAETGAAFVCAKAGISPAVIESQAAYVQGWCAKWRTRHLLSNPLLKKKRAADESLAQITCGWT